MEPENEFYEQLLKARERGQWFDFLAWNHDQYSAHCPDDPELQMDLS